MHIKMQNWSVYLTIALKKHVWIIFLGLILSTLFLSEVFSLTTQVTIPTNGSINYNELVLKDEFVVDGEWWNLDTVNNYMYNLSEAFPSFVRREEIGVSCNGYSIYALIIGLGSKYMVIDGAIHGNEKTGTFGALKFANYLIRNWNDQYWNLRLRKVSVVMVPVLNPDGFVKNSFEFDPPNGGGLNGHGKNLNRQFPPGCTNTTEPEALAYLHLWAKYPPSVLVSHHTGQMNLAYWSQYMDAWDDTLVKYTLQIANQSFVANNHTETAGDGTWLGKMYHFYQAGYNDMTVAGAGYLYGAAAVLPEFWRPYTKYANAGTDFFFQIDKAMLSHLDNTIQTRTAYSSERLVEVRENSARANFSVTIALDPYNFPAQETISKIYSAAKPTGVSVDGTPEKEGTIWYYDSATRILTVKNATKEIVLLP